MGNFKNFFPLTVSDEIENMCSPLVNNFNCNFFIYQKNFLDEDAMMINSSAFLCNNSEALEFILNLRGKRRESAKYDYNCNKRHYLLLETTQPKFTKILREKFNFNHILCRDEKIEDGVWEHFIIGTSIRDDAIINNYFNSLDFIDKFAIFFRNMAHKHIKKACDDKFVSSRSIEKCCFHAAITDKVFPPKHFHLIDGESGDISLTLSEARCLILFCKGRTAKEIAKILGTSFRTVERHIQNGKLKMNCTNKGTLYDILSENNVIDLEL